MKIKQVFTSCLLVATMTTTTLGADQIRLVNQTDVKLWVWLWSKDKRAWEFSALKLVRGQAIELNVQTAGDYYVAVRDATNQEYRLAWINVHEIVRRKGSAELVIVGRHIRKQTERTYAVTVPIWETRTRTITVYRRIFVDGMWRCIPEQRILTYKVRTYKTEQRTGVVTVTERVIDLLTRDEGQNVRSTVTFKTEEPGAFIRYQAAAREEVFVTKKPTTVTDHLDVGIYVIWAERNGEPTSKKERYNVYDEKEEITIPERL